MRDYGDLEKLLFRGFLTTQIVVGGVPLVLKSINQKELDVIQLQCFTLDDTTEGEESWRYHTAFFLAYSILFFNRQNLLPDRTDAVTALASAILEWPLGIVKPLMVATNRLNTRTAKALEQVEAYSYGPTSKRHWMTYGKMPLNNESVTGLAGTSTLGLNLHQTLWMYFNSVEDLESEFRRDWSIAKFITSPHAPKDIKKIDQTDTKRRKERETRREKLFLGYDPGLPSENAQVKISNETAEELMAQMDATVRGEKDFHDYVIEQHQMMVRDSYQRQQEEAATYRKRLEEARLKLAEEKLGPSVSEYTPEEVAHFLRVSDERNRTRRNEVPDEYLTLEERERNLVRWGFIDSNDIPERGREQAMRGEDNPLIQENYERVAADLHMDHPDYRDPED